MEKSLHKVPPTELQWSLNVELAPFEMALLLLLLLVLLLFCC